MREAFPFSHTSTRFRQRCLCSFPPRHSNRTSAPAEPAPATCVAAEIGDNTRDRPAVAALQLALNQRGFDPGGIDGFYGGNSRAALSQFVTANAEQLLSFTGGDGGALRASR